MRFWSFLRAGLSSSNNQTIMYMQMAISIKNSINETTLNRILNKSTSDNTTKHQIQ